MLGVQLKEIAHHLFVQPASTRSKVKPLDSILVYEITLCWFLRLWFIGQIDPLWLDDLALEEARPDCPHTGFQLVRLLCERGIYEPSSKHREVLSAICPTITFCGQALEPATWWNETSQAQGIGLSIPSAQFKAIVELAKGCSEEEIIGLFPQVTREQLFSDSVLVSSDVSVLIAKLFIYALKSSRPWPNFTHLVNRDETQVHLARQLPPESASREYKATLRWDTRSQQKNSFQTHACLKTLCGFLNGEGGTLIIGVDDRLNVIGLEGDFSLFKQSAPFDEFIQVVHELIKRQISPNPIGLISASIQPYGEHSIAVIEVKSSELGHYLTNTEGGHEYFIRDGNRTNLLRGKDLERFHSTRASR